jgi:hypothetical protein
VTETLHDAVISRGISRASSSSLAAMPKPPIVLIPPSEGKAQGGEGSAWTTGTMKMQLDTDRVRVLKGLGAPGKLIAGGPTMPAIERYSGVLYKELAYRDASARDRKRIDAQVLTFSGLWGLVAPRDPIPFYKLKMSASLAPLGKLAAWWRPRISPVLDTWVAGRTVWDLLPNEHLAAWPTSDAPAQRIRVVFLDEVRSGRSVTYKPVSHWNKLLKGSLVRFVAASQATEVTDLKRFRHPEGYCWAPDRTEEHSGVITVAFVKPQA